MAMDESNIQGLNEESLSIPEESIEEKKGSDYELYHKTFSAAMQHAYAHADAHACAFASRFAARARVSGRGARGEPAGDGR